MFGSHFKSHTEPVVTADVQLNALLMHHQQLRYSNNSNLGISVFMSIGTICFTVCFTVEMTPPTHGTVGVCT